MKKPKSAQVVALTQVAIAAALGAAAIHELADPLPAQTQRPQDHSRHLSDDLQLVGPPIATAATAKTAFATAPPASPIDPGPRAFVFVKRV
jgi:hypothetical protein